jgi:diguanylate cyclase (GGDEF)-like protein
MPPAHVTAVHAAQAAVLLVAALTVIPAGEPLRDTIRAAVPALVLLGSAALFADTARRDRARRPPVPGALLAAALAGLAATTATWSMTGGEAPGWGSTGALIAAEAAIAVAVWLQVPKRRSHWSAALAVRCLIVGLGATSAALTAVELTVPGDLGSLRLAAVAAVAGAALPIPVLSALPAVPPSVRRRLRWLAAGLLLVAGADLIALADTGTGALLGGSAGAALLAAAGFAVSGLAANDVALDWREDRRRPAAPLHRLTLPVTSVACCFVILGGALVDDRVPRPAAGLALAALALALARTGVMRGSADGDRADSGPRTDDLTGLANRRALSEALAGDRSGHDDEADWTGWTGWAGWAEEISLLLVDLDRFKDVNEAFGHGVGDQLLTDVGARLRSALRPSQLLARLGGDEFAVVLPGAGMEQAKRVAAALRQSLAEPFVVDGEKLHVEASVGIASCQPTHGEPTDLLRQADVAMYQAKASGTRIEVYDPARDQQGGARLRRIEELREALERGDLEVHVQPQVDLHTGAVTGAEALARWRHPEDGVLLPDSFLPLAEQTGLMRPVATLVLERALAACATWWSRDHKVPVSVNLSAEDLRDPELPAQVSRTLRRHDLPAGALRVEITEQALLTDPKAASALLDRWRADGVSVAIDDFGTGYSSLSYLRELPVDEVKLDRAFIADIERGTTSTIVRHTVAMAHGLWARVVAEGIEDEATARILADLGCDVGQGLHFGAAMTTADFLELLERESGGGRQGSDSGQAPSRDM